MSRRRAECPRARARAARWLLPAALLALAPKCVLCVLAYVGLGTALGLSGPELCSAASDSPASWTTSFAWLGLAGVLTVGGLLVSGRRRQSRF
jgi:LPXTG-motif cell wall-anchored protein